MCTRSHFCHGNSVIPHTISAKMIAANPNDVCGVSSRRGGVKTRGSVEPPRLVTLSYVPKGAAAKKKPVVLVRVAARLGPPNMM